MKVTKRDTKIAEKFNEKRNQAKQLIGMSEKV